MILPITAYGYPVLKKKAQNIQKDYPGLRELIANMFETMYNANGVGLAAPQVNKSIRLIVIDASYYSDEYPELEGFKRVFVNAKILEESGDEWLYEEGCLSVPGIREDVSRKSVVRVEYYNEDFERHEEVFDGIVARIFMHEYDHIEGVLFVDRISPLRKMLLKGKLNDITIGKVDVAYKMIFPLQKAKK